MDFFWALQRQVKRVSLNLTNRIYDILGACILLWLKLFFLNSRFVLSPAACVCVCVFAFISQAMLFALYLLQIEIQICTCWVFLFR